VINVNPRPSDIRQNLHVVNKHLTNTWNAAVFVILVEAEVEVGEALRVDVEDIITGMDRAVMPREINPKSLRRRISSISIGSWINRCGSSSMVVEKVSFFKICHVFVCLF
jgi:hypothetical protein